VKRDIRDLTIEELGAELAVWGEPRFRTRQIFDWIYRRGAAFFREFTDLPKVLRDRLDQAFWLGALKPAEHLVSRDGAEKFLFRLSDGQHIETVLIPAGRRKTVCLSSQVGCKFACDFCASGLGGFRRNLRPAEMIGQILFLRDRADVALTNYVFMGMGEPLDNFDNLARAIRIMNAPEGLDIAARRITISTAGVVPGIEQLKSLDIQVNLSLSLHAVEDELRSRLMPINKRYPLEEVLNACEDYVRESGRMMTIEYVLLGGVNDSVAAARRLASIARRLNAKVNLIPYSRIEDLDYKPSPKTEQDLFLRTLEALKGNATLRRSKGATIRAACGQLAGRLRDKTASRPKA
jgi:23S rRNA (adenine2503-C2)-methyltransferase